MLKSILKRLAARYTVSVTWEGVTYTHLARSLPDAFSWLSCYPKDARAVVHRNLNGLIVAARGV